MGITHGTVMTGVDNPAFQSSKDEWNAGHSISDGTSSAPGIGFTSEATLGLWRIGSQNAGFSGSLSIKGPTPWADVVAYGSVLDGTTVNTTTNQAAIDAVHAAGGGTVYSGVGANRTQTLKYYGDITFLGAGMLGSEYRFVTSADFLFKNNDITVAADRVQFRDLFLSGFFNQTNALGAINFTKGQWCRVDRCRLAGFKGSTIRWTGGTAGGDTMYGTVFGSVIDNMVAGGIGIELVSSAASQPDGANFIDTTISAGGAGYTAFKITGVLSRGAGETMVTNCRTIACETIFDSDGTQAVFTANRFEVIGTNMIFNLHPSGGAAKVCANFEHNSYAVSGGTLTWTDTGTYTSVRDSNHSLYFAASGTGHTANAGSSEHGILTALTQNITMAAPTSPLVGQHLNFQFLQDGTGGWRLTWNAVFNTVWQPAPAAGAISSISFYYDGTSWQQFTAGPAHDQTGRFFIPADGLVATPSVSWASDPDTGLYRVAANSLGITAGGAQVVRFTGGQSINAVGTVAAPSVTFDADTDTGLYWVSSNVFGLAARGLDVVRINGAASAVNYMNIVAAATLGTVQIQAVGTDTDVSLRINNQGAGVLQIPDGAVGLPGLAFGSDTNTGIYRITTDSIGITVAGVKTFQVRDNAGTKEIGFFAIGPAARASAYTQTYSTATKTHSNDTASDMATTAATTTTPWGFATQAQADAIATKFNALRVDVDNLKGVVNSVIDDLQAYGLLS